MRKSITPVVSITLLIFITIIAGVSAFAWVNTVQSDLQESISANIESFPGSDCSHLNLIAMRGDSVVISNTGCNTVNNVSIFIDGVLTDYDLNAPLEPGQAITITFTALSPNASHTLQIALTNGDVISHSVSAYDATSEAGFTGGEEEPEEFTACEEISCSAPYIMFEGDITDSLNNACPCCGDDGFSDVFYNSTYMCSYGGVIFNADSLYMQDWYADRMDYASGKGVCELEGFKWMEGSGNFNTELVNYSVSGANYFLAVGDVDNDGWDDVVTTQPFDGGPSYQFSVSLNDGDGTFASSVNYFAGNYPWFVVLGDVDNDGWLDVVYFNWWDNTFSVSLNDGDGTFASPVTYSVGAASYGLVLGDVDNDGWLDVIVSKGGNPGYFMVFLNDGDGTFVAGVNYQVGVGAYGIAVGDVDGDGWLDIVNGNSGSSYVSVSLNDGDGTFAAQTTYSAGSTPRGVAFGDLDNDGWLDIVAAVSSGNIAVLLNDGDGTFASSISYPVNSFPMPDYVTLGDVDNDGWLDIVVTHRYSGDFGEYEVLLSVLLNDKDGTFAASVEYPFRPYSLAALSDVNHDGDLDLIFPDVSGWFSLSSNLGIGWGSNGPCCGDDGVLDEFGNSTFDCCRSAFLQGGGGCDYP